MIVQKHIVILFLLLSSLLLKAGNADTTLIKQHLVKITKTENSEIIKILIS